MYSMCQPVDFPLLSVRSYFSLMSGALSPATVCNYAARSGYRALALTDADNLYALPEFADAAAERGLKAIAACSMRLDGAPPVRLWCMNKRGYRRLCALLTMRAFGGCPDVVAELARGGWDGLALAATDRDTLGRLCAGPWCSSAPDSPYRLPFVALDSGMPCTDRARLAKALGLPLLAVAGGSILDQDDADRLRLLHAIDRRVTLSALASSDAWHEPGPEDQVPTQERALALFSAYPDAVTAACRLAQDASDAAAFFSSPPAFPAWQGKTEHETFAALRSDCEAGVLRRYGPSGSTRPDISARLSRELSMIRDKGFSAYFLVVRDIVSSCPRTCGRGSAASSLVAYLLGLTHVDPLRYDLFFDRFLNEGRIDPPDIDIDFPWDERPAILARVLAQYAGSSAMVADHCRFSGRSRVREPALALGKSPDEAMALTDAWRSGGYDALPPELARAAALLKGVPRNLGTHPGGVVVVPGPMSDYAPTQPSAAGLPLLAWEKDGTERAGLVKIDLLGNRSLAVLRDCIELVSARPSGNGGSGGSSTPGGKSTPGGGEGASGGCPACADAISWERFDPVDQADARALIESGNTIGIFYIESPATRQLLSKMRVADYIHLVAASSIIRPAANRFVNEYVHRLKGGLWKRMPEAVEACLKETYGIMVYQEDVSRVAMAAAGFSSAQADGLRKTLSKKRDSPGFASIRSSFMDGCAKNGMDRADIDELWTMMLSFDGYSFCKAHSASYALVSYRLAWMKATYPGLFICSVINNGGGFYGTQTYVDEARRLGYRILPPHINHSGSGYAVEQEPGVGQAGIIRAGLSQVAQLAAGTVLAIVAERNKNGPFTSLDNFLSRIRPSYDALRPLVLSGCLDGVAAHASTGGEAWTRPRLLWAYHEWRSRSSHAGDYGCGELFASSQAPACVSDYDPSRKLAHEAEFLGLILSAQPAALYEGRAHAMATRMGWPPPCSSAKLTELIGKRVCLLGVAVAGKEVMASTGMAMCFRSFSDSDGVFETVIFPQAYRRLMPILESNAAFLLFGTPRNDAGAVALHLEDARGLNRPQRPGVSGEYSRSSRPRPGNTG